MMKTRKYVIALAIALTALFGCEEKETVYNYAPPQVTLISPDNGTIITDLSQTILSWRLSRSQEGVAVVGTLYYGDDTTNWESIKTEDLTYGEPLNLVDYCQHGKKYYWKVEGHNDRVYQEVDGAINMDTTVVSSPTRYFLTSPLGVTELRDSSGNQFITLEWGDPKNLDHIEITCQAEDAVISDPIIVEAGVQKKEFTELVNEVIYTFTVNAVDQNGNASLIDTIKAMPLHSSKIQDGDLNIYNTFTVNYTDGTFGTWMQSNLQTTQYRNKTKIPIDKMSYFGYMSGSTIHIDQESKEVYYSAYLAHKSDVCPSNYHVSTDEDWKKLEAVLGLSPKEVNEKSFSISDFDQLKDVDNYSRGSGKGAAYALMTKGKWTNGKCAPNDCIIPFFAEPVGYLRNGSLNVMKQDTIAFFLTSNLYFHRGIHDNNDGIMKAGVQYIGGSIRCVKDK